MGPTAVASSARDAMSTPGSARTALLLVSWDALHLRPRCVGEAGERMDRSSKPSQKVQMKDVSLSQAGDRYCQASSDAPQPGRPIRSARGRARSCPRWRGEGRECLSPRGERCGTSDNVGVLEGLHRCVLIQTPDACVSETVELLV